MHSKERDLTLDLIVRTSRRKEEARSPKQQRDMATSCCDVHGYSIGLVHDSGGSESGKTMDREGIRSAMERVRSGETDGIIVALTDRLGRAPIEEAMTVMRELASIGGVFVPADAGGQPVDLSDPQAETNLVLQLQMARQFWLAAAKRARQSKVDAIERGAYIGGVPLGYQRPQKGQALVEDPQWSPVVREAFQRAAADGLEAASLYLREHVPSVDWTATRTRYLLGKRAYLGESRCGDLVNLTAHPALVSPVVFEAAQIDARPYRATEGYPLSGLGTCSVCGAPIVGSQVSAGGRRKTPVRRYRCSKGHAGMPTISATIYENFVRDSLKAQLASKDFRALFSASEAETAKAVWLRAQADLQEYAEDVEMQRDLGKEAYRAGAKVRRAAVAASLADFQAAAALTERSRDLPGPDELDDDHQLVRAIVAGVRSIVVHPGRWVDVADRVIITPVGLDDDGAGEAAA